MVVWVAKPDALNALSPLCHELITNARYGPCRAERGRAEKGIPQVMAAQTELIILAEGIVLPTLMILELYLSVLMIFPTIFHMADSTVIVCCRAAYMAGEHLKFRCNGRIGALGAFMACEALFIFQSFICAVNFSVDMIASGIAVADGLGMTALATGIQCCLAVHAVLRRGIMAREAVHPRGIHIPFDGTEFPLTVAVAVETDTAFYAGVIHGWITVDHSGIEVSLQTYKGCHQ